MLAAIGVSRVQWKAGFLTEGVLETALKAANRDVDERLVISALSNMALRLVTRQAVLEVDPRIFGSELHAEIWSAARKLAQGSRMMTTANMRPHLSAGALRRFDELSGRPVREVEFTEGLKLVADASRRRELLKAVQQIAAETATADTAGEALSGAHEALAVLEGADVGVQSVTLADALDEFWDEVENPSQVVERFPTPWPSLNALTLGGHARGDLITFMAPSGGGKTILLMQEAAKFAAEGRKVAIFSLEMSRIQLTNRLLASTAGVSVSQIALRDVSEHGVQLSEATGKLESANVHIFESPDMTIQDMRSQCAVLKRLHGLDVVVIDYIQRVTPSNGHSRETEVGHIVSQMKKMAMALNVAVLTASQMNEKSEGGRPTKESARESRVIVHESNLVVALHGHDKGDNKGEVDMVVVKNRDGQEHEGLLMWWKPEISSVLDPTG